MVRILLALAMAACWHGTCPEPEFIFVRDSDPPRCHALEEMLGRVPAEVRVSMCNDLDSEDFYYCRFSEQRTYLWELDYWVREAVRRCTREGRDAP